MSVRRIALALACSLGCALPQAAPAAALPRPAHVVVIVEENKTLEQIVGAHDAPYLTAVAERGALFTHAYAETHPSQPNYLALFSGRMNANGDDCPANDVPRDAPNLASELLAAHLTFAAFSEALPATGFRGCWAGSYARKHAPWTHFSNVPQALHHPLADLRSFDGLPTVTFIVPDVDDDMHDGSIKAGDDWAERRLAPLLAWAASHDTLVVFTWDEGYDRANSIPTMFVGPMVRAGRYPERIDHLRVLRTLEEMYGLPPTGNANRVAPILDVWR